MKILMAGGGTGGHLFPALAIAEELRKLGHELLFIGTSNKIEAKKVPERGFNIEFIKISGFHRSFNWRNFLFPIYFILAYWKAWKIVRKFRPDLAIGTGGYVSGIPLKICQQLRIPIYLQEQNSFPGVSTRLLAKKARKVYIAYDKAKSYFPANTQCENFGNPSPLKAEDLMKMSRKEAFNYFSCEDRLTIGVMGGSLGARNINNAIERILNEKLLAIDVNILWQCGEIDYPRIKTYQSSKIIVSAFINNMAAFYTVSDLVIARAGAISLTELALAEKASLLVPLMTAAGNHQMKNAELLSASQAAEIINDDVFLAENLVKRINLILQNEELRLNLSTNIKKFKTVDVAKRIANDILSDMKGTG